MLKLEWIRERVEKSEYYFSRHGDNERLNDNLLIKEVEEALFAGKVIERYKDERRGESCLVAGFADSGKPIHVVCGARGDWMAVVTVYIPKPPKFKTPYERGGK